MFSSARGLPVPGYLLPLELEGDERRVDELEETVSGLARIVHWRTVSEQPTRSISLAICAAPRRGTFPIETFVWRRTERRAPQDSGLTQTSWCEDLTRLEPIADMVGELPANRIAPSVRSTMCSFFKCEAAPENAAPSVFGICTRSYRTNLRENLTNRRRREELRLPSPMSSRVCPGTGLRAGR